MRTGSPMDYLLIGATEKQSFRKLYTNVSAVTEMMGDLPYNPPNDGFSVAPVSKLAIGVVAIITAVGLLSKFENQLVYV